MNMLRRNSSNTGLVDLIGNNEGMKINSKGYLIDAEGYPLPISWEKGYPEVEVESIFGRGWYKVSDLIVFHFKALHIPLHLYGEVVSFFINGNPRDLIASNIGYRFREGKLEVPDKPGWYYIPGYTSHAINKDGELFNVLDKKYPFWMKTRPYLPKNIKGGYAIRQVYFDKGKSVSVSRHRAMLMVFTDYPDNVDDLVCNHIDGVPGHDTLDNLEFVTRRENNIHAYKNGLKNQQTPVLVRNARTGEVREYYSVCEAARQLGCDSTKLDFRLHKCAFSRVFSDGLQFKLKSDPRDWVIPEDVEKEIEQNTQEIHVVVRDCTTGEEKIYHSIGKATRAIGVQHTTVAVRLRNKDLRPIMGYQIKYAKDDTPWPKVSGRDFLNSFIAPVQPITGRNLITGREVEFENGQKAGSLMVGVIHNRYQACAEQRILCNGWQFKYAADDWRPIEDPIAELKKVYHELLGRHVESGKIVIASSSTEMGEILQLDRKEIRKALMTDGQKVYKGWQFRFPFIKGDWPEVSS